MQTNEPKAIDYCCFVEPRISRIDPNGAGMSRPHRCTLKTDREYCPASRGNGTREYHGEVASECPCFTTDQNVADKTRRLYDRMRMADIDIPV